jgi:hypothetical protein
MGGDLSPRLAKRMVEDENYRQKIIYSVREALGAAGLLGTELDEANERVALMPLTANEVLAAEQTPKDPNAQIG